MRSDLLHRVRWANVARVAAVLLALALVLAWPRLRSQAAPLPPTAVTPALSDRVGTTEVTPPAPTTAATRAQKPATRRAAKTRRARTRRTTPRRTKTRARPRAATAPRAVPATAPAPAAPPVASAPSAASAPPPGAEFRP
jgi:hypothetical protein